MSVIECIAQLDLYPQEALPGNTVVVLVSNQLLKCTNVKVAVLVGSSFFPDDDGIQLIR